MCNSRLRRIDSVSVPAVSSFSGQETFGVAEPVIKRRTPYNDVFDRLLLRKTERSVPSAKMTTHALGEETTSLDLVQLYLPTLGYESELFLAHIWHLLILQPAGEEGILLTDGYANVFHVRVAFTGLLALGASWKDGWEINADTRIDAVNHQIVRWRAGCRVFSY
jgi:hypothetical protein